jgi:uncharacterized damage-inducible protein DinB
MDLLVDLFRHNAWANRRLLDSAALAPADFLGMPGAFEAEVTSCFQQLQHMFGVERGFADVLAGEAKLPDPPGGMPPLAAYADDTAKALVGLAARATEAGLAEKLLVPWWEFEFPKSVLLSQVLSHSGQHRAELAMKLAGAGIDTGNLDYIVWARWGGPEPGAPWPPAGARRGET